MDQRERVGLNALICNICLWLWLVRQSVAAVKHNDVILTLGLLGKQHVKHTPINHVSLLWIKIIFAGLYQKDFVSGYLNCAKTNHAVSLYVSVVIITTDHKTRSTKTKNACMYWVVSMCYLRVFIVMLMNIWLNFSIHLKIILR